MEQDKEPIQQINEIRDLMERSSRFMSLSGLSGVSAGIIALIGAAVAFYYLDFEGGTFDINRYFAEMSYQRFVHSWLFLSLDALLVLLLALFSGVYFSARKAHRMGLKVWDHTARRLLVNLLIPLVAGGIFCLVLIYHHLFFLVAPATLIFYGMALLNAGKYSLHELRALGIAEIMVGLMAAWLAGYGLIFWAVGFGVLHIFYGLLMYYRYEEKKSE